MESLTLKLPAMYADHHVIEVRRVLSCLSGIGDIYASSAFQSVEIEYDSTQTNPQAIEYALDGAGYLSELSVPVEIGTQAGQVEKPFFRHTTAYTQVGRTVSFAQEISATSRPLWPCPGMGVIRSSQLKEADHA
ncbi:MAG: heavy-metal-associated domain-containing protein [Anaerolineales bacterium]|nr:heavy-metal-associated domain-containing protein [Anaerolineales bacterium]